MIVRFYKSLGFVGVRQVTVNVPDSKQSMGFVASYYEYNTSRFSSTDVGTDPETKAYSQV